MRLAFSNIAWAADADARVLSGLRKRGYAGVEVAPTRVWEDPTSVSDEEIRRFRRLVESHGLPIVALQSLLYQRPDYQLFGDAAAVRGFQYHLAVMARLAAGLGASRLVFGSPTNRRRGSLSKDQAIERAAPVFLQLGTIAEDLGVCFCIEANPPEYDCDFLTDAVESTAFVRTVDSPGVRLHLDAACMALAGDDPAERVSGGADVLAHVHASAPALGVVGGTPPVQHALLASALREVDYSGFVSVEMRPQADQLESVWRAADYVKEVYG